MSKVNCPQMSKPRLDRPSCLLSSAAEVYVVRRALTEQLARLDLAVDRLTARDVPQVYMMAKRRDAVKSVLDGVPEGAVEHALTNKEQIDRAANACEGLITSLRISQRDDWCQDRSVLIGVITPLLDRIRIGWKRPAQIPEEVLAEIKRREGGRFWNPNPGDWLQVDDECVYVWKQPDWDCVDDWEWRGI